MRMLKVKEVAELCDCSTQTVIVKIRSGIIKAEMSKQGQWLIPETEVDAVKQTLNVRIRRRKSDNDCSGDKLDRYMKKLKKWCDEHPDSDITPTDYGKAVLRNIIK